MDNFYILRKAGLKGFLRAAMKAFCLVGPQKAKGGDFLLQEIDDVDKLALDYDITSNTLKGFFFPRRETVFTYEKAGRGLPEISPARYAAKRPTIFFGVRSCDIRAVHFQDMFFGRDIKDPFYWRRREKAVLISFGCNAPPRHSCFCVNTKSGPFLEQGEGFDLQLSDIGADYLVEVGSGKGNDIIKKYRKFFTAAARAAVDKRAFLKEKSLKEFDQRYDLLYVMNKLKTSDLGALWKALGKRCTNCGGCEFICPTCFCFYHQDLKYSQIEGARIRAWDSCTFIGYSRMAGDNAPHEPNSDRIARRFFCKLYNCYSWFRVFGCTGCGRCSFVCPVNLDMESFIDSLMRGEVYKPLLKEL